ncbi:hypothetical protein PFJ87_01g01520 [Encephalitozoon hellem]|uniref:Transmembrane protein n=1 Tax=Encephalitozoon hellem TaxID=27973 RepID=A0ABY8CGA0_ENCHE|nr:hypothetical protein PFJ87_01g01520 [Encephalitozoon hellem]
MRAAEMGSVLDGRWLSMTLVFTKRRSSVGAVSLLEFLLCMGCCMWVFMDCVVKLGGRMDCCSCLCTCLLLGVDFLDAIG